MKKSYLIDINQKHGHELSKKLYRTITELSKRLDDARSCARSVGDLFTPSLLIQRKKFTEYSEKLIFSDPALYGHKGEELLWRKGYYEVISAAKKLKKKEYSLEELSTLELHINAGIGFYHLFLSKLQVSFDLTLITLGDFLHVNTDKDEIKSELSEKDKEWAAQSVHQCLIYLGDLNRYKLEIYPNREPVLATRYYLQAISYKPDHGMPHNQMGTLAMSQNANIEAVYHYMRGLACKFTFEGTTNNLINLFDKNSKFIQQLPEENENADCIVDPTKTEQIKRFIARFILLIDIWYFDKTVSKVYNLCHQTFKNLDECLAFNKASDSEGGETPTDLESLGSDCSNSPRHLSSEILFQVSVICLLCISKLQKNKTQQVSTVTAFTLAVYSQLIQNISNCVQASVSIFPLPDPDVLENGKKKRKPKQRRRKPLQSESEDSELSEQEEVLSDSSDDSFISDKEDVLAESSEEELEVLNTDKAFPNDNNILQKNQLNSKENKITKTETELKQEIIDKIKRMDVNDVIEILSEQGLLRSIKVLNDWLVGDASILKSCGANTKSLMRQITYLLNILNVNSTYSKLANIDPTKFNLEQLENNYPLAEDVTLMGLEILDKAQKELDWNLRFKQSLTFKEETLIRIRKINCFGKYLTTIPETGIKFDENENIFVCQYTEEDDIKNVEELEVEEIINGKTKEAATNSKGQLMKMKHMGQLWLASEVRALENRVRGKSSLSPYLVLDADALIKYTFMVKHLVHSRKFIVIVPTSVMTALDDLKREKPEARDAIRWLESQFHRGNRFFRAQRPQEKSAIPFIKYPKKRDKEMNIYIQIIECCYFLTEQQKDATDILTLLIGKQNQVNGENNNKDFSYLGLAQSAGINVESITQFYAKWKKSTKENR